MPRLISAARAVLASGRVVSAWSIGISLPFSLTVMAPTVTSASGGALLAAGLATWACFAAALGVIAVAERGARGARTRLIVVVAGVLIAAAGRPIVQDAWLIAFSVAPPATWQLPFRIATNVVVWSVLLAAIAVIVDALRSLRATNAMLRAAIAEIDAGEARALAYAAAARATLARATTELRHALGGLDAPDGVRGLASDGFRAWSHELARLADAPTPEPRPPLGPRPPVLTRTHRRGVPFRLPPIGTVTLLYAVCLLPYAMRTASPLELLLGSAVAVAGGAAVDLLPRDPRVRRRRLGVPVRYVGLSLLVGAALSVVSALTIDAQDPGTLALAIVPLVVYVTIAIGTALCSGSIQALRAERQRLSGAVAAEQRASRAGTRPERAALREAAELLHRDGQGRCVIFALEHPEPTATELRALTSELERLLERVESIVDTPRADAPPIDSLVETWSRVLELRVEIDVAAQAALADDPQAASDVYDVIAEGLLNAVKHANARRAVITIAVVSTGGGPQLRVRVVSPGPLRRGAELRPSSHVRALGARLAARGADAALEASIAFSQSPAARPVVSAEHPGTPRAGRP